MKFVNKLVDFYLYSSIHIALGAALSVLLCYAALIHLPTTDYPLFVFSSTLFLYCIHRIVGINKVKAYESEGRFAIIKKFKTHLILYTILGAAASTYFYFMLPLKLQLLLLLPALVAFLYVLPIFSSGKRLRDYHLLKIFLIVFNWAIVIGLIPYIEARGSFDGDGMLYTAEKLFFIFAITLPFDVRDLKVDEANSVSTIPLKIGIKRTYHLSYLLLSLAILLVACLTYVGVYTKLLGMGLTIGYLITLAIIRLSRGKTHDYYYSGLLDGTIAMVALIGIGLSGILGVLF